MPEGCVVDTSCLIVLDKVGLLSLLCEVYKVIYLPKSVVKEFGENLLPKCIRVIEVSSPLVRIFTDELNLGLGEAETIAYAYEQGMEAVIDDAKARKVAQKLSVKLTGTIGILIKAEKKGVIESSYQVVLKLKETGFRVSDDIVGKLKEK
ncbi:MAG: DUF3368 domain-containing protein [Candidatus Neomarinimicrobiota bacterium]|nr:DUF3368 domain-containing protein [Candidatus Neomarinimicrobiota bacterium]RKY46630.1 MAG: DUF3368 domain-containing protein [Candidatus Neomarinimicrobiota bacterium]RKY53239.1 MAG: DUF3368 domain-containing protein [Candidatus Neomarinimicrobiota bacterium]